MAKRPVSETAQFDRAVEHHRQGRLDAAEALYRTFLARAPDHPDALCNLAVILRSRGNLQEAIDCLRKACEADANHQGTRYNLGNAYLQAGAFAEAEDCYRAAIAIDPDHAGSWYNLAYAFEIQRKVLPAIETYAKTLQVDPDHHDARLNLGVLLAAQGRMSQAQRELERLHARAPNKGAALNNLATLAQDMGDHGRSIELMQQAIAKFPDLPQPRSNLLMELQYHPAATPDFLRAAAAEWGAWATARAGGDRPRPAPVPREEGVGGIRPLRVGYVSADLCMHPVGLFLKDVLAAHDPGQALPFAYANGSHADEITADIRATLRRFHAGPGGWCDVHALDDTALADRIRADGIDILVDLSGHTGKTRLPMFARRPAPVQVSWLGYFATTGLPAMDAVILDPWHAPEGTEAQFTETIVRLPHNRFCYRPVSFAPAVSPAPALGNGFVTFGSFNNTAKLNDDVLTVWAAILGSVPGSRLILKWRTFADGPYSDDIRGFFTARGIAGDRIELRPASPHRELLEQYADIDIALDPFPFSGGHTSCEALWMGVPVITWPQARVVSRQTFSFLANIGLTELAASGPEDYVARAVALAEDSMRLAELRQGLRARMALSPLCDAREFTGQLERAYRWLWTTLVEKAMADRRQPA